MLLNVGLNSGNIAETLYWGFIENNEDMNVLFIYSLTSFYNKILIEGKYLLNKTLLWNEM